MAWNGSTNAGGASAPAPRKAAKKSPSLAHGLIAGGVIVCIGIIALYFVTGEKDDPTTAKKAPAKIAEADPVEIVKSETPVEAPKRPKHYWEEDVMPANLTPMQQRKWKHMHRPPPGYTNDTSRTEPPPAYAIFPHHSENTIAGYLTMTPGETLVGTPHYGPGFKKDFLESMKTPIIITAEDTPEQAELKQLMIDTKIDLAERMRNGEDIGKILEETHEEYQRLATLKMDVANELNRLRKDPNATLEDVEDFAAAANKLLAERGIAPITLSPIAKRMLLRRKGVSQ